MAPYPDSLVVSFKNSFKTIGLLKGHYNRKKAYNNLSKSVIKLLGIWVIPEPTSLPDDADEVFQAILINMMRT